MEVTNGDENMILFGAKENKIHFCADIYKVIMILGA